MILEILSAFLLFCLGRWYLNYRRIKNGLSKWIFTVPGVPIFGNALDFSKSTETLNTFRRYRKQYGDIVLIKFFSQIAITTDYKLAKFILSSNSLIKVSSNYNYLSKWLSNSLLLSNGKQWSQRRKAITPSFNYTILKEFMTVFERNSRILVKKLENHLENESIDIYNYINLWALDNICESAMGVCVNAQENINSTYSKSVKRLCEIIYQRNFSLLKSMDFTYPLTSDFWEERKLVEYVHKFTNSVIEAKRKELKNSIKNNRSGSNFGIKKSLAFLDMLFDLKIDGQPLTNEEIREEVDMFMFTGHDTIASGVSFILYCLSKYPEIQQKVFEEQQLIFDQNENREIEWCDLQNMRYLEQVIKESLRLYPPVPLFVREIEEDVNYGNNLIPKDTTIIINVFDSHRNPEFFPNAEKFDPDRFDNNVNVPPYAYIPFSAGPRNCIGQKFAMIEMETVISTVLRSFKICLEQDYELIMRNDLTLKSNNGVRIRLEKRTWT